MFRLFSIQFKIVLLFIVSLSTLTVLMTMFTINKAHTKLVEETYNKLMLSRDIKAKQIESLFNNIISDIEILSVNNTMAYFTQELIEAHKKLNFDEKSDFPVNYPLVQEIYKKYEPFFQKYKQTYGYYDIFLVCEKHGHVMYTAAKESDLGANLKDGILNETGLSKVWEKVKKYNRTVFVDMQAYAASNNRPAMFVGSPVYDSEGKMISILVFQISDDKINQIMHFRQGYGKTQEDYLVGHDKLMRSDSYLDSNNHSIESSFHNPLLGSVDTIAVSKAFEGQSQGALIDSFRNLRVYSAFKQISIGQDLKWAIISEIDENEVSENINQSIDNIIKLAVILLLFTLIISIIIIRQSITKPLVGFKDGLLQFFEKINKNDINIELLDVASNDEIGRMAKVVNEEILTTKKTFEKNEEQTWIKDGINKLNEVLITSDETNVIAQNTLNFLCNYVNAGVGVLYIYNEYENSLNELASFAYSKQNDNPIVFKIGEGIVGQVAVQKSPIELKNIKAEQLKITTGTISENAYNTYTAPLLYKDKIFGVIEIGAFEPFSSRVFEFIEIINKIIATSLSISTKNERVKELFEFAQIANNELRDKQNRLEEVNAYIEEQKRQLEEANVQMEEQQQQLEEANAQMEEQQQQLKMSEHNLKIQNLNLQEASEKLEKQAQELIQSSRYKSEFLANMSHELRTPLNSIILLSSLLAKNSKKTLNEDEMKKARIIYESGNELLRLINDILDLSKIESGKMTVLVDTFDSKEFLKQMFEHFEYAAINKNLELKIVDEYNGFVYSDRDKIGQIIRNLISNAMKFTKEGSVTIKISNSNNVNGFRISVIDTGIGIPYDKQKEIFKAFIQADGSTSREYGGTGLGLSISKELSHLLGGDIELISTPDVGSEFIVNLPNLKSKKESSEVTVLAKKVIEDFKDDREILTLNDEAFLIIDDDMVFSEIVYKQIKNSNHLGLVAHDAKSGLELIEKYNIKGILLDLTLPDMDGMDLLNKIKSNPKIKDIPVHIISSKDKDNQLIELGAIGYAQKPILSNDVDNILKNMVDIKKENIKNLLIVQDDLTHREALIELIGDEINVKGVDSSKEAISEIKKDIYDSVIVDLGLNQGSGYEVCEFIKNSYSDLPIIIYTGKDLSEDEKNNLQKYSSSIIVKTLNSHERVLNDINIFLNKKSDDNQILINNKKSIDLSNLNILIVDDDIKNIYILDSALKEFKANVITSFNGAEAIEKLKNDKSINFILMDIMMPVMNGYEAIEEIKKDNELKDIPIIAVTAKAMSGDREKCLSVGADDYISKPIDLNILGSLIKAWSDKKNI